MESVITKPKKKKSKQKRLEESIGLIEGTSGNASSPTDDIILSPITSKFSETDILGGDENVPLCRRDGSPSTGDVREPDPIEICAAPEEELCELSANVMDLAIAPELDLISTNFENYYRKEGEALPESSLPSFLENNAEETGKHNLGCSNIEDEFFEVTKAAATVNELPSFTESQLLSLYHNEEIGLCNVFIESFLETELRSGFTQRHTLYDLLNKYLKSRDKLNSNVSEIESLMKETKDIQQRLWILEVVKITESGECQDGNPVEASHQYQVGTFDEGVLAKLTKTLAMIRERANEQHALHSYSCLTTKLQIENYVRKLISTHSNLPHNAPVSLITEGAIPRTSEICGAISVLFHFLRQPYKDQGFISDCRNWLQNIVATLLRVSSWREHMFLLNHVLRCPGNISKWATSYIQAPIPLFDCRNPNLYLDHMVCVMATIVGPVKNREMFLSEMEKSVDDIEDKWVIVDSEGEDEDSNTSHVTLSENDIIALFNQIPLDCLFSLIFDLQQRDGKYIFTRMSGGQMLKTIAVTRLIIKILGQGFFAYNIPKYLQFAKRLASTMVHTVQFLTDVWETFR
uniref:Ectopic P granules protein 5 n=2 Tax=Lygus hesperus TaxID=30085 RepID=A0A0A9XDT5_LYGHE